MIFYVLNAMGGWRKPCSKINMHGATVYMCSHVVVTCTVFFNELTDGSCFPMYGVDVKPMRIILRPASQSL